MKLSIFAMAAAVALATPAQAEHLAPRNGCFKLEGADASQMSLATAVANHSAVMLEKLVDPEVLLDFGGGSGWDEMRGRLDDDYDKLWDELDKVTRLGCATAYDPAIAMPYYWGQKMPDEAEAYDTYIVLGDAVPVYRAITGDAVVRRLSWEAVSIVDYQGTDEGAAAATRWEIRTFTGTKGFVERDKLRSLVDYRLLAERGEDGRWRITHFIAGD